MLCVRVRSVLGLCCFLYILYIVYHTIFCEDIALDLKQQACIARPAVGMYGGGGGRAHGARAGVSAYMALTPA
jgi:hypothetical protein